MIHFCLLTPASFLNLGNVPDTIPYHFTLAGRQRCGEPYCRSRSTGLLRFVRSLNITGAHDLVNKDQSRAKDIISIAEAILSGILGLLEPVKPVSVGVTNTVISYVASVGIGSPPTSCERPCFISGLDSETRF